MATSRLERSDQDAILPVSIGSAAWAVALIVLVSQRAALEAADRGWWIGAAAVGLLSGTLGLAFLVWRRERMRRREQARRP